MFAMRMYAPRTEQAARGAYKGKKKKRKEEKMTAEEVRN